MFVYLKDLAKVLHFDSPAAQNYCKAATDHQKSWDILRIAFIAGAKELLLPYVREKKAEATSSGFDLWVETIFTKKPYLIMYKAVFTYLLAVIIFRAAVRKNCYDAMLAARYAYRPIWFVCNHPVYRGLEFHALLDRLCYPPEILNHAKLTESFSLSGNGE